MPENDHPCAAGRKSLPVVLHGPAGLLEGRLDCAGYPQHVGHAVVCHPHPLYGGSMQNKVVHTLARAMTAASLTTLRFNFRGVGMSDGRYDDGIGESDDALAACTWLEMLEPGLPLVLGGFSFGSFVALRAAGVLDPVALITVAPPVRMFEFATQNRPHCPWLVIQGDEDEIVESADVVNWVRSMAHPPQLEIMSGASHFFHGRLPELRSLCSAFLSSV